MIRRVPRWAPTSFVDVLFTYKCATTHLKLSGSGQPCILLIDSVGQKLRQETSWGGGLPVLCEVWGSERRLKNLGRLAAGD